MLSWILSLRWLMLIASLGSGLGALVMFWIGAAHIVAAIVAAAARSDAKQAVVAVMGATDAFIFGVVLLIFAYAITFGFAIELSPAQRERLPDWMRLDGIGALKRTLMEVIVVYLAVDFATDVAEAQGAVTWLSLVKPAAIVLIAGALRLLR